MFGIALAFGEYHHDQVWRFMAWSCLALVCGATGAMWIVAPAKWVLIPLQKWPTGYPVSPSEVTRWVETGSTLIGSVVILLMLLAPALLSLLPRAPGPVVPSKRKPVAV